MLDFPVRVDRTRSAKVEVLFLLIGALMIPGMIAYLVLDLDGGRSTDDQKIWNMAVRLFISGLMGCIFVGVLEYAATKVVFWVEVSEVFRYRNLFRVHELRWSRLAVFRLVRDCNNPSLHPVTRFFRKKFGTSGSLELKTTDGLPLEVRINDDEWQSLIPDQQQSASLLKPLRLNRARASAFIAVGLAALPVGIYAAYLIFTNQYPERARLLFRWSSLLVIGGLLSIGYGVRHLVSRGN